MNQSSLSLGIPAATTLQTSVAGGNRGGVFKESPSTRLCTPLGACFSRGRGEVVVQPLFSPTIGSQRHFCSKTEKEMIE